MKGLKLQQGKIQPVASLEDTVYDSEFGKVPHPYISSLLGISYSWDLLS